MKYMRRRRFLSVCQPLSCVWHWNGKWLVVVMEASKGGVQPTFFFSLSLSHPNVNSTLWMDADAMPH